MESHELTTLKLYSPLTADLYVKPEDEYEDVGESFVTLDGWDLRDYKETVLQAIEDETLPEEQERGLMKYLLGVTRTEIILSPSHAQELTKIL